MKIYNRMKLIATFDEAKRKYVNDNKPRASAKINSKLNAYL